MMAVIALVAQLDRASVFGTEGWGFEPLRVQYVVKAQQLATTVCDGEPSKRGSTGQRRDIRFRSTTRIPSDPFHSGNSHDRPALEGSK
jgi:hypothetical protein